MLKYYNYDIVFQEYPDEVTLAINLTMCPNRCVGCHSAYLREDIGEELTHERLTALIDSYDGTITCVGIQGGDNDPEAVLAAGRYIKQHYEGRLRTGWYSGRTWLPDAATPCGQSGLCKDRSLFGQIRSALIAHHQPALLPR